MNTAPEIFQLNLDFKALTLVKRSCKAVNCHCGCKSNKCVVNGKERQLITASIFILGNRLSFSTSSGNVQVTEPKDYGKISLSAIGALYPPDCGKVL